MCIQEALSLQDIKGHEAPMYYEMLSYLRAKIEQLADKIASKSSKVKPPVEPKASEVGQATETESVLRVIQGIPFKSKTEAEALAELERKLGIEFSADEKKQYKPSKGN